MFSGDSSDQEMVCLDDSGVQETMALRRRWHPGDYHTPGGGGVHKQWCQGDSGVQETIMSIFSYVAPGNGGVQKTVILQETVVF